MLAIRPIMKTLIGLPLAFSPCKAKVVTAYSAETSKIVSREQLKIDTFQKSATKVLSETAPLLPVKSGTTIKSRTSLTPEELDKAIDELIKPMQRKTKKNALRGKGKVFHEMGEKYGVNPVSIIAIAMTESGRGVSSMALSKNNIGGLMGKRGGIKFDSVDSCIESMAKLLQKHVNNGRTTIDALGRSGKYCAKSHSRQWIKDTKFYIKKIEANGSK